MPELNTQYIADMPGNALNQFLNMKKMVGTQRLMPGAMSGDATSLNQLMAINPDAGMQVAQMHMARDQFNRQQQMQQSQLAMNAQELQLKQEEAARMRQQMEAQQRALTAGSVQFVEGRPYWVGYDDKSGRMTTQPLQNAPGMQGLTEKEYDAVSKGIENISKDREQNVQPALAAYQQVKNVVGENGEIDPEMSAVNQTALAMAYLRSINPGRQGELLNVSVKDLKDLQGRLESLKKSGFNTGALSSIAEGRFTPDQMVDMANTVSKNYNSALETHKKSISPWVAAVHGRLGDNADKYLPQDLDSGVNFSVKRKHVAEEHPEDIKSIIGKYK